MKTNLYNIYKSIGQRYIRKPITCNKLMKDLAKQIIEKRLEQKEIIKISREIISLENSFSYRVSLGQQILDAVEQDNYEIKLPYVLQHQKRDCQGYIYILTSPEKKDQIKIGATTMNVYERIQKYQNRYKTQVSLYFSMKVDQVFKFEKFIQEKYFSNKVKQNIQGDSNEWFYLNPLDAKKYIITIQNRS